MNERGDPTKDDSPRTGTTEDDQKHGGSDSPIGTGKKVGLYGCGLLLLGLVIVAVILFLTGVYVPFEGTEGVGP
jgi:hypothetical protein